MLSRGRSAPGRGLLSARCRRRLGAGAGGRGRSRPGSRRAGRLGTVLRAGAGGRGSAPGGAGAGAGAAAGRGPAAAAARVDRAAPRAGRWRARRARSTGPRTAVARIAVARVRKSAAPRALIMPDGLPPPASPPPSERCIRMTVISETATSVWTIRRKVNRPAMGDFRSVSSPRRRPGSRGDTPWRPSSWIPAFAGMTEWRAI